MDVTDMQCSFCSKCIGNSYSYMSEEEHRDVQRFCRKLHTYLEPSGESVSVGFVQEIVINQASGQVNLLFDMNDPHFLGEDNTKIRLILSYLSNPKKLPPILIVNSDESTPRLPRNVFNGETHLPITQMIVSKWLKDIWREGRRTGPPGKGTVLVSAVPGFQLGHLLLEAHGINPIYIDTKFAAKICPVTMEMWHMFRLNYETCQRKWLKEKRETFNWRENINLIYEWVEEAWKGIPIIMIMNGFERLGFQANTTCRSGFSPVEYIYSQNVWLYSSNQRQITEKCIREAIDALKKKASIQDAEAVLRRGLSDFETDGIMGLFEDMKIHFSQSKHSDK